MKNNLLPNYYKKIGLILSVLSFIFLVVNLFYPDIIQWHQELIKWIFKDILLISLLLVAFAREKAESDKTNKLRTARLKQSFLFGVAVLVLDSISELSFNLKEVEIDRKS